jgi:histidinol dehydrogenase
MRLLDTSESSADVVCRALTHRDAESEVQVEKFVRDAIARIRESGDEALISYERQLDWPEATADGILVTQEEIANAAANLDSTLLTVLQHSAENIRVFHQAERSQLANWSGVRPPYPVLAAGDNPLSLGQIIQPVQRAGVYVPGGKALYPSTVLMAAIPAIVAGVYDIIICTPPDKYGKIDDRILAAAHVAGVQSIYKLGGAPAIAAMAYGTETVPRVDVIVGPGNAYVNVAKRLVYGDVGIDMLAGPSEIAIIADDAANPAFIAADLLAQTEHGPGNRGVLFTSSQAIIDSTIEELDRQRGNLSRQEILNITSENLLIVKTRSQEESIYFSNILAPEHLELHLEQAETALTEIRNAGAVLVGPWASAPIGDYYAGPSHTLPTAGTARFSSPLSVNTFLKRTSIVRYSKTQAIAAAGDVALFAESEGFDAHAEAARQRVK